MVSETKYNQADLLLIPKGLVSLLVAVIGLRSDGQTLDMTVSST